MKIGTYNYEGRVFDTLVFDSYKAANAFMMFDSEWGVISKPDSKEIHVARLDDNGTLNANSPEFVAACEKGKRFAVGRVVA